MAAKMNTPVPEGVSEQTLRELMKKCNKCPKCKEICLEDFPVLKCTNDHRLCKTCFVNHLNDPCFQCENKTKPAKGKEPTAAKLDACCRFSPDGCKKIMQEMHIKDHEAECKFRPYECFGKTTDTFVCHWTGNQTSLLDHFAQVHKKNWANMSYKHESFIPVTTAKNLQLFKSHNKHFIYVYKYVKASNKAYAYIAYLGPQEEAKKFCYEMEFFIPEDPVSQLKFREICLSDAVPTSEIISTESCIVLPDKLRKRYTSKNKLCYRFWIKTTDIFGKPGAKKIDDSN